MTWSGGLEGGPARDAGHCQLGSDSYESRDFFGGAVIFTDFTGPRTVILQVRTALSAAWV